MRLGMSMAVSGSVHSTTRISAGCRSRSALRVRSAGSGHLRPRRLRVFSVIQCWLECWLECGLSCRSSKRAKLLIIAAMALDSSIQRIARLTPLGAILARVEAQVDAVTPRSCALNAALGAMLAKDVVVSECPPQPIALRDGYAVEAAAIADATSYAPLPFASPPPRIEAGAAL